MNQIGWDMRYTLPNKAYLDFVSKWLLEPNDGRDPPFRADPFAVTIPEDQVDTVYVSRVAAEDAIGLIGNQIVTGPKGWGKSTLCSILPNLLRSQAGVSSAGSLVRNHPLVVRLFQTGIDGSASMSNGRQRRTTVLTPWRLARSLFNAYWEELFRNETGFDFYSALSRDTLWRERLHWYYTNLRPVQFFLPEKFELMAWLLRHRSTLSFAMRPSPVDVLKDLMHFVTYYPQGVRPFARVTITVDVDDALDSSVFVQLANDAQKIYSLGLKDLDLKLFINDGWCQQVIDTMETVYRGEVPVVSLPPWDEISLHSLLYRRLGQHNLVLRSDQEFSWGEMISRRYLEYDAQKRLSELIVAGVVEMNREGNKDRDSLGTPIHALRLARGVLTACSGFWASGGFDLPLSSEHINELARAYWDVDQEIGQEPTVGERSHLQNNYKELKQRYENQSQQIRLVEVDIDREPYEHRKPSLKDKLFALQLERDEIVAEMSGIERLLV